tara:strand:- start:4134 stop:5186 length:1053 start_codon:yes stop_codon:yes gene_type:complete
MEQSPLQPTPVGALRFNTDSSKLEYYDGNQWVNITSDTPDKQTGGTRGLFHGFFNDSDANLTVDYVQINTTGNAIDFGDMISPVQFYGGATSSRIRSYYMGGQGPSSPNNVNSNQIQYFTISTTGNGTDYGDLTTAVTYSNSGASNGTRGLSGGGGFTGGANTNTIEYFALSTSGSGKDFGDLRAAQFAGPGVACSKTRSIFTSNAGPSASNYKYMDYVQTATLGNASDFGDQSQGFGHHGQGIASNAVRGVLVSSYYAPAKVNTVEYITMATLGNSQDFGDLTQVRMMSGCAASSTRLVVSNGRTDGPAYVNTIDYHEIMTTGNFIDFGDSTVSSDMRPGASNGHGGLG